MTTLCVTRVPRPADGATAGVVQEVRVTGDLDLATASTVDATLRSALGARPATLIVDLSAVTFCDSTGLRPLIDVVRRGRRLGVAVILLGVPSVERRAPHRQRHCQATHRISAEESQVRQPVSPVRGAAPGATT
jgi:anti-anti-sigma factor